MQLEYDVHQHINASHGMFVPGQFGTFPKEHSQTISGLTCVGNHSKYDFGELRVNPVTPDETKVKKRIEQPKSEH